MGSDRAEARNRADKLQDSRAAIARAAGAHYLPPRVRLEHAARLHGADLRQTPNPDIYRGRCPVCGRARSFVLRLDDSGDIQRKCFRGCSTADIQQAAPVALDILKANPYPADWQDTGSEHAAGLGRWWHRHGDALDAPPRRRAGVVRLLYAYGKRSSVADSPEFDASVKALALDAGRDPRRLRGANSIIDWVLALPSRPVTKVRGGGVVWRAGRRVQEVSRWRLNIPPAVEGAGTATPPNVAPGGNTARGIGGEIWRTLEAWPDFGRAAATYPDLAARARPPLAIVTVKRHVRAALDLGLALEVPAPPIAAGGAAANGRPRKCHALISEAAAAIERGDDAALCALARLAPERQNLRGKAARKMARAAETFARAIQSPRWGWSGQDGAADLEAWRTRPNAAALDVATVGAATAQPSGPAAADAAADIAAAAGITPAADDIAAAIGEG